MLAASTVTRPLTTNANATFLQDIALLLSQKYRASAPGDLYVPLPVAVCSSAWVGGRASPRFGAGRRSPFTTSLVEDSHEHQPRFLIRRKQLLQLALGLDQVGLHLVAGGATWYNF